MSRFLIATRLVMIVGVQQAALLKFDDNLQVTNYVFLCYLLQYRSKPFVKKSAGRIIVVFKFQVSSLLRG